MERTTVRMRDDGKDFQVSHQVQEELKEEGAIFKDLCLEDEIASEWRPRLRGALL
jgi:hypothetical protein